ncbi:transcription factor VBP-like [Metopolophium dirhodum]|uniref:transcription factor VBP-like n=1 Tax=Metopolophium dirhodum TaxID=44670 RepID=UPI00298FE1DD|nr:transcription factor VBP-like [Metopolophium dirhodum]
MDSLSFGQNNSRTNCQSCGIRNNYSKNDKLHGYVCDCKIYGVQQMQLRRLKTDTPREKKDAKYFEKRKRNNMAAKKSREAKRRRDNEMALKLFLLEKENMMLKFRLSTVSEELEIIKRTLVLYNTNQVIWTNNVLPPFQKK